MGAAWWVWTSSHAFPFDDDTFDAVITESVAAFPEDKQRAADEYVRVTKPGGYVGLNESTWLKTPPPPDVVAWASQEVGAQVEPLTQVDVSSFIHVPAVRRLSSES